MSINTFDEWSEDINQLRKLFSDLDSSIKQLAEQRKSASDALQIMIEAVNDLEKIYVTAGDQRKEISLS